MEDLDTLTRFINNSELPADIKDALLSCVLLELRNSPTSEFQILVKKIAGNGLNED